MSASSTPAPPTPRATSEQARERTMAQALYNSARSAFHSWRLDACLPPGVDAALLELVKALHEAHVNQVSELEDRIAQLEASHGTAVETEPWTAEEWERRTRAAWAVHQDWSKRERQAIEDFILTVRYSVPEVRL